jgi:hypothetical protein
VTAALTAALRACAVGFHPSEAGTGLLISHGGFPGRPGFGTFIHTGTSITDGITEMAEIKLAGRDHRPPRGTFPCPRRRAAHPPHRRRHGRRYPVTPRDAIPGLDDRNLKLIIAAMQHAAGHRPPHP